jgi:plastocyanin
MVARTTRLLAVLCLVAGCVAAPAGAASRTLTFRIGPIALRGYSSKVATKPIRAPGITGSISYMHARVVDAQGRLVPQQTVMLHHIAFVNDGRFKGDRRQHYCHDNAQERFYGTGEEDESMVLPPGYGYHVRANDRWHASWMLMNHRFADRTVYIEYTLTIAPGWHDTPVTPYWLGVAPCPADPIFEVPGGGAPGSDYVRTISWTPPADGRIVAIGTHLHGGAKGMRITEPRCGDRTIAQTDAEYGEPDDPIYHVIPQIHEPGPRAVSYPLSPAGIPIRGGETYRVQGVYDDQLPHARVMAIMHAYVAPATAPVATCAPLPGDVQAVTWDQPFRTTPPQVLVPLTVRGADGRAKAVSDLPGSFFRPARSARVLVEGFDFSRHKIEIRRGASVVWKFADGYMHDVTTANGPRAFGSQYLKNGQTFQRAFNVPGTYRVYCTLHPVDMHQIIKVR